MFYYLFVWEMRHLHTGGSCPVVSGQGVCDYAAEAMPNFSFCYVTSSKTQLFCAPILTTNLAAVVCVCVQNLTNFCPHAFISNPNVPKILFA